MPQLESSGCASSSRVCHQNEKQVCILPGVEGLRSGSWVLASLTNPFCLVAGRVLPCLTFCENKRDGTRGPFPHPSICGVGGNDRGSLVDANLGQHSGGMLPSRPVPTHLVVLPPGKIEAHGSTSQPVPFEAGRELLCHHALDGQVGRLGGRRWGPSTVQEEVFPNPSQILSSSIKPSSVMIPFCRKVNKTGIGAGGILF